jgi:hypothetical protein
MKEKNIKFKILLLLIILFGFFGLAPYQFATGQAKSSQAVYPAPHYFRRWFRLLVGTRAKRLRLGVNVFVKFYQKMVPGPVAGPKKFSLFRFIFASFVFFVSLSFALPVYGATIYADNALSANCTSGNYSVANHNCTGSAGNAYATIQSAVTACSVGDTIYIRGGNYNESDIDIPANKNGSAWTAGNFTTLASYPGEWAIINGGGTTIYNCLRHTNGYDKTTGANPTQYWKFERLEITGCRNALWFTEGPLWIRYCYIHDNHPPAADEPEAGLWINLARENIVEYNYFYNNGVPGGTANYSNIGFDADYRDDENPTTFDPNHCTRKNTIRYNYIKANSDMNGIHYKNQQRFGTNTRTSAGVISSYADWGDKIHHNIIEGSLDYALTCDQDNCQAYNNIVHGGNLGIEFGFEQGLSSSVPRILNAVSYNNTVILANRSFGNSSGCDASGDICYDDGGAGAVPVPYTWHYNNISDQNHTTEWQEYPFVIAAEVANGRLATMTNVYIKNNLIHSPTWDGGYDNDHLLRGRAATYTMAEAAAAFSSIANNYVNTTASLYTSGYITNSSFIVSGSTTIANGGIGGSHPYLSGVTMPSYVGATNPNDNSWVAGVLGLATVSNLQNGGADDPNWIEGGGSTPDVTPPAAPSGLSVN